jgi:hypothetical protein
MAFIGLATDKSDVDPAHKAEKGHGSPAENRAKGRES